MRIVPLTPDLAPAWDAFVDHHPAGWWWHRSAWLEYEAAREGNRNLSFAVLDEDGVVAISPLILEAGEIRAGGEPIAGALVTAYGTGHHVPKDEELSRLAREHQIRRMRWRAWPGEHGTPIEDWPGLRALPLAWRDISWQTVVLDLSKPLTGDGSLWAGIRRSYHSPIKRAAERYDIVTGANWVSVAQGLHRLEAGRVTRPQRTWDLMAEWVRQGYAQCYVAQTHEGVPVAFAYFYNYKGWVYYGHAASSAPFANHLLLWQAIQDYQAAGAAHFEVGWVQHGTDAKSLSLEHFKRGWGGSLWPVRAVEWRADG